MDPLHPAEQEAFVFETVTDKVEGAVKVTLVPEQIFVLRALILTAGTTDVLLTTIIITLLDTVAGKAQAALLVSIHITWSLLFKVDEVNVVEFVPTFEPFTCH